MHEDEPYKTTDLNLASALIALDHHLIDLQKEGPTKFSFWFKKNASLVSNINSYWDDTLMVSARKLLEVQKSLKARIYSTN